MTDRKSRQKISRQRRWNYVISQLDLTDIYRPFCSTTAEDTFFSIAHRIFTKTDPVLASLPTCSGRGVQQGRPIAAHPLSTAHCR